MNLIEQLGGYGKAKKALIDAQNSNDIDPIIYINDQEVLTDCVCDALIQYRRENNIFEVGDAIVSAFDNIKMFGNSTVEIARFRDDINCIDLIEGTYVRLTNGCDCNLDQFRHATDKEIAQGYRDE